MKKIETQSPDEDVYYGTSYVARLLAISVGTVQNLVESNKLVAWKTGGGHRRISLKSVLDYQREHGIAGHPDFASKKTSQVLIVEDDADSRKMYEAYFDRWALPLDVVIYSSAIEALMDLHFLTPVVLLTDLQMSNMNGFEFINAVRKSKLFSTVPIVAITGLTNEDINEHGGLDPDMLILKKPIDMEWLKGFLQGIISAKNDS